MVDCFLQDNLQNVTIFYAIKIVHCVSQKLQSLQFAAMYASSAYTQTMWQIVEGYQANTT